MSSVTRATLVGALALLLWSTLGVLAVLLAQLPPFEMVAISFALAALVISANQVARRRPILAMLRQPLGAWALGVGGLFGYHCLYFVALRLAPPVEANLLNHLWPLLIVLFSALLPGERLQARHLLGAVAGMAGGLVLIGRVGGASFELRYLPGYCAALACALIWSSYSVANRHYRDVPSDAVGGFCAVTALLALACHLGFETSVMPRGFQWPALLALGLGPLGLSFFVWDHGCKHGNIRTLGVLAYLVPLASNGLLIVFGYGQLTWAVGAAAVLIVGGAAIGAGDLLPGRRAAVRSVEAERTR